MADFSREIKMLRVLANASRRNKDNSTNSIVRDMLHWNAVVFDDAAKSLLDEHELPVRPDR